MEERGQVVFGPTVDAAGLTDQIRALQTKVYGEPADHDPALSPRTAALVVDGRVVAVLDILTKEIEHAGSTWTVSGVSWVLSDPDARRRGHGARLVSAVHQDLRTRPIDLVVFTCDRELVPFYESAGFEPTGAVLIGGTPDAPFPSDAFDVEKVTMMSFVSDRALARRSDFHDSRIALHPGSIDRLW